jgi:hypothetical protein
MKHPGGAPSKYNPSMCEDVLEYMKQGDSKIAVAAKLNISRDTLYEWAKEHKEFSDTIKRGVDLSQAFWEDLGKELVLAGQGNATAWIYNMKCRFREDWADLTKTDITSGGKPIMGGTAYVPGNNGLQEDSQTE